MDASGIQLQIVSTWTDMAGDNLPNAEAARWARLQNVTLAEDIKAHPNRFLGMATLPMCDPVRAIKELNFVVEEFGIRSVEIGTNINGRDLDHPDFRPLWRRIRDLDVFVLLHPPMRPVGLERTGSYFLNNLISYPVDTTIAAARLLFSGLFQELKGLKICLAHSGGFLPYQIGRMDRGYEAHPACKKALNTRPSQLINAFIYDSLTHNDAALSFLVEVADSSRVVYGSDYPFEMLDPHGIKRINALNEIDEKQRADILGGNMRTLLNQR
jgi:aminocarboxymuconate-semialdehyde decarboxylase